MGEQAFEAPGGPKHCKRPDTDTGLATSRCQGGSLGREDGQYSPKFQDADCARETLPSQMRLTKDLGRKLTNPAEGEAAAYSHTWPGGQGSQEI